MRLLVATNNPGKVEEYRYLLRELPVEITSLGEEGIELEPEETGTSFEENAVLKAKVFGERSRLVTLADDSGLEVDALDGAPGVYSARYGGTGRGQDVQRYQLLLRNLADLPWEDRTARFRCVVAVSVPGQPVETASGTVEGIIAYEPQGTHGFGYDPVFYLPGLDCTMAQLPPDTKNSLSHRAEAVRAAFPIIERIAHRKRK